MYRKHFGLTRHPFGKDLAPEDLFGSAANRELEVRLGHLDRKSTRLNSSHLVISYAVFCLKKKKPQELTSRPARRGVSLVNPTPSTLTASALAARPSDILLLVLVHILPSLCPRLPLLQLGA